MVGFALILDALLAQQQQSHAASSDVDQRLRKLRTKAVSQSSRPEFVLGSSIKFAAGPIINCFAISNTPDSEAKQK